MREKLSPPVPGRRRFVAHPRAFASPDRRGPGPPAVTSVPDVNGALKLVESTGVDPGAIVVDTARRVGPEDVALLLETRSRTALVLVAGRLQHLAFDGVSRWCAACPVRAGHIGDIVGTVGRVVDERGDLGDRGRFLAVVLKQAARRRIVSDPVTFPRTELAGASRSRVSAWCVRWR